MSKSYVPNYTLKAFRCGSYLEVYKYSRPISGTSDWEKINQRKKKRESRTQPSLFNLRSFKKTKSRTNPHFSATRAKNNLKRLINSNVWHTMLTLTFKENQTDLAKANEQFILFRKRLKRRYPNLKYVSVIEFQKRGAVHYHLLTDLKYINPQLLSSLWGQGFVTARKTHDPYDCGGYLLKYITKDVCKKFLHNKKKYSASRNLDQPILIYNYHVKIALHDFDDPIYTKDYQYRYYSKNRRRMCTIKTQYALFKE